MATTRNITLNLKLNNAALKSSFQQLIPSVQQIIGSVAKWKEALVSVNQELTSARKDIAKIYAQASSGVVEKRIKVKVQREEAAAHLAHAETKEQLKPGNLSRLARAQVKQEAAQEKLRKELEYEKSVQRKKLGIAEPKKAGGGGGGGIGGAIKSILPEGATAALAGVGAAVGVFVGAAAALKGIASEIVGFVSKANPGAVKRFTMATEDTIAVIGHSLTPIVELFTKGMRLLGDVLASILPSSAEMREAFSGSFELFDELRDVFADIAPVVKDVISFLVKLVGEWLRFETKVLKRFFDLLREFGILQGGKTLKDSTGAAARPVTLTDSVSYAKSIYTAIGSSAGKEPQKETAENTRNIFDVLKNEISQALDKLPDRIGDSIDRALGGLPEKISEAIKGALPFGRSGGGEVKNETNPESVMAAWNVANRAAQWWHRG